MRILGPASAPRELVIGALGSAEPQFLNEMFPVLWDAALAYDIDPVGMVAQSYKETGGGTFARKVKPWFYNTAGIQIRHKNEVKILLGTTDDEHPLLHAQFASWHAGAEAQAQHLCAYTGKPVPDAAVVDPRYWLVKVNPPLENFEELGGRWAPSPTYGTELVAIARRLQGRV